MTMLLFGGTGQIGSAVVSKLATERGIDLRVLTPNPDKAQVPANVTVVKGDVLDMASMRSALAGVGTLFLLNPVVADEHTPRPSHFAVGQGRRRQGCRLLLHGQFRRFRGYAACLGQVRRRADDRALRHPGHDPAPELLFPKRRDGEGTASRTRQIWHADRRRRRRDGRYARYRRSCGAGDARTRASARTASAQPRRNLGPRNLDWLLHRGDLVGCARQARDLRGGRHGPLEKQLAEHMSAAMAFDTTLMFRGFQRDGMLPSPHAVQAVEEKLGRPLRTNRAFAEELQAAWRNG